MPDSHLALYISECQSTEAQQKHQNDDDDDATYIVVSPSLLRTTERRRKKLKCSNGMLNDANTVLGRCLLLVNNYILYIFIQKSSGSAGKYIARLCSLLVLRNVMVGNSFGKVIGMHWAAFRILCCCCMMMENLRGMRIHLSRVCVCVDEITCGMPRGAFDGWCYTKYYVHIFHGSTNIVRYHTSSKVLLTHSILTESTTSFHSFATNVTCFSNISRKPPKWRMYMIGHVELCQRILKHRTILRQPTFE